MFQRRGHRVAFMARRLAWVAVRRRTASRAGLRCIHRRFFRAARRATRSSDRRADRPARAPRSGARRSLRGSAVCSSGRSARRFTRRMMISASTLSQIETALPRIRSRVSSRMNAPPPVASTPGPPSSSRAITRASPSLKCGSPWVSKMSGIDIPAAVRFRYRRRETAAAAAPPAAVRWWICRPPSSPPARPNAFPAPPRSRPPGKRWHRPVGCLRHPSLCRHGCGGSAPPILPPPIPLPETLATKMDEGEHVGSDRSDEHQGYPR
jgi:hypothetical protein